MQFKVLNSGQTLQVNVVEVRIARPTDKLADRIFSLGYNSVEPENPYWKEKGITIEDPDGWRIVLMNTKGI